MLKNHNGDGKWSRDILFVFACVGAAVGLGNLWRFPYVAYENGGGAFLVPYVVCLLLVGVPLAILEMGLGLWAGGSVAKAFRKTGKIWTWIGWWALINSLVIVFYYSVVLGWCVQFVVYSVTEAWGGDPSSFFVTEVLGLTSGPFQIGGMNFFSLASLFTVWLLIFLITRSGIRVIGRVLLVTVPLPLVLLGLLTFRSMAQPGSKEGIVFLLKPDFGKMLNVSVWAAAASQVVLSLGLGMGQIVAYASKKRDDKNVLRSAVSICSLDLLFSLMAGITVFAMMGFLAHSKGVAIGDLKLDGLFLAFVSYPMALSSLPLAPLWGVLFFVLLVSLGIDSAFAAIEANITGFGDIGPKRSRKRLALLLCSIGFFGGIVFTTGGGLYWLDIVDHWVANYAIASIVVLECIVFSHFAPLQEVLVRIKKSWGGVKGLFRAKMIYGLISIALLLVFGGNLIKEFAERHGDYPLSALLIGGWGVCVIVLLLAVLIARIHNRTKE